MDARSTLLSFVAPPPTTRLLLDACWVWANSHSELLHVYLCRKYDQDGCAGHLAVFYTISLSTLSISALPHNFYNLGSLHHLLPAVCVFTATWAGQGYSTIPLPTYQAETPYQGHLTSLTCLPALLRAEIARMTSKPSSIAKKLLAEAAKKEPLKQIAPSQ